LKASEATIADVLTAGKPPTFVRMKRAERSCTFKLSARACRVLMPTSGV
jgi:hypothetical protein